MEATITREDRQAMAEVDYIIHHMNERYLNLIPKNVQEFIYIIKKKSAKVYVDPRKPLESQGLKQFTLYFLMILNLKYWCNDERRKEILVMLERNQQEYEAKVNNIFDQANSIHTAEAEESREVNAPKQVVTVNPNQNAEHSTAEHNVEAPASGQILQKEEPKANALDNLKDETGAAIIASQESFFKVIINKIKSFFAKK